MVLVYIYITSFDDIKNVLGGMLGIVCLLETYAYWVACFCIEDKMYCEMS